MEPNSQGAELSFTHLVSNASLLVQIVMLILLLASVLSWSIIFLKHRNLKFAKGISESFEDQFWNSGKDLTHIFRELESRKDEIVGLEVIFLSGFREFIRLHGTASKSKEMVMDGTYRAMKVSLKGSRGARKQSPDACNHRLGKPLHRPFRNGLGHHACLCRALCSQERNSCHGCSSYSRGAYCNCNGTFAAIPAVIAYNRYSSTVEKIENDYINFMDEFSTILNRRVVTSDEPKEKEEQKS